MRLLIQNEETLSENYDLKRDDFNKSLVALTPDNVARIEAMIRNDSAYLRGMNHKRGPTVKKARKDDQPNGINKGATLLDNIGSSAFWMGLLKAAARKGLEINYKEGIEGEGPDKETYTLRQIIAGAIAAVDSENSTHLNANGVGRILAWKSICKFIEENGMGKFQNCLQNRSLDLFNYIADQNNAESRSLEKRKQLNEEGKKAFVNKEWLFNAIKASEKDSKLKNHGSSSFASKFCHYAAFYLFSGEEAQDNYPIFDGVLREVLPLYLERYGLSTNENNLDNYSTFMVAIDELRDAAKKENGAEISRNGLDHLLWYFHKGRMDDLTAK